jgi:hypothetical protein
MPWMISRPVEKITHHEAVSWVVKFEKPSELMRETIRVVVDDVKPIEVLETL